MDLTEVAGTSDGVCASASLGQEPVVRHVRASLKAPTAETQGRKMPAAAASGVEKRVAPAEIPDSRARRMVRDRGEAALFFERYENSLRLFPTNREAYEQTERWYATLTGRSRFRTYGSFRSAYCQFCRRLQRNRRKQTARREELRMRLRGLRTGTPS